MNSRNRSFNLLMLAGSILLTLGAAEVFFRVFSLNELENDEAFYWDHMKDAKGTLQQELKYDQDIGFVKKELRIPSKKEGEYRVVILGDSISDFGLYVKELESKFKNNNKKVTIINTGTVGYNTEMELSFLKKYLAELKPDLLLHQFCMNDFSYTPVLIKDGNSFVAYNLGFLGLLPGWLVNSSELMKFLTVSTSKLYYYFKRASNIELLTSQQNKTVKESLKAILKIAQNGKFKYRLLLIPYFTKKEYKTMNEERIYWIVRDLRLDSNLIDTIPLFPIENIESNQMSKGDYTHPNLKASKIIAGEIFKDIRTLK